ncbi:glycosyltransferase family 4 protein [Haloarcula salina]|uniref:Glycosyltransferase family 4 protein n=1 Tax=Haloarcula salina TaxID=1429914 RepID=A0AA41G387_9EURY|nr:glycosyltransferase family 4 protein [Haloarcula salina]MBV0902731.1 glycosyltransferase family 4 protein [Haloarcula salina]
MTGTDRIAVVTQQYPPDKSGHASRMNDVTRNMTDHGWAVEVLAPPPCFPHGEFDRDWYRTNQTTVDGVTVRRLWAWQPTEADPGTLSRLAYYITFALHAALWLTVRTRRYDAVLTTTPPISTGVAGFVTAVSGLPWVVDVRDLWIDASVSLGFITEGGVLERTSRRFQRAVLQTADAIAVTTETLGEHLCQQYGADLSQKIFLVPNGVDVDRFESAGSVEPSEQSDDPLIVYVGNIGHAQNLGTCIRAMGEMERDVELRLIGGGDTVPELRETVEATGVSDSVTFAGPMPHEEIPSLLASADIGIAPLVDDGELAYAMPTKVYEYMGAGLPVVTTGRGEVERFIASSNGGIHAESDVDSIARAFDRLLADDDHRERLGESGQAYVRSRYDRSAITETLHERLCHLIDRGETAPGDATDSAVTGNE